MNNVINLFTDGKVKSGEREFTRLVGGFGDDKPTITTKQIAELLNKEVKHVNERINDNLKHFEIGIHLLDLKVVEQTDHNLEALKELGYNKMSISKAKSIYILSKVGFLLYLKFAEGDKSVEIYKDFLEDYFKTKAENAHMKVGIQEQIVKLKDKKASALGMGVMSQNPEETVKYLKQAEEYNLQILELEKLLSKEEVVKDLQSKIHMSELIENAKGNYDMDIFAKTLNIKGMGRNNLFKWLREQKILKDDNVPYQKYMDYFTVIPVVNSKTGYKSTKTLLKPKGIDYVVKRLIKGKLLVTKSVEDILNELEQAN